MSTLKVIITSPSLDVRQKVAGISAVTNFIIKNSKECEYQHFEIGTNDGERRNLRWVLRMLKLYLSWCRTLLLNRLGLVHFNVALTKPSVLRDCPLILMARLFRMRTIIHLHGGEYLMDQPMPVWMRFLLRCSFSGQIPVIALSPLEADVLQEKLKIKNLLVLPNCVDLNEAAEFQRIYGHREPLKILFLGRICEKKGLEYIYQALEALQARGVDFRFTMAGIGPEEPYFTTKFSHLLGQKFSFMGVVHGAEKKQLLQTSNVFLLPSFFEGLPMALLEGMSFGLVPITTDVGSIPTVINNGVNGIFVERFSHEGITSALEQMANNPVQMDIMSQMARKSIFSQFNPSEYISRLNEFYQYA